MSKTRCRNCGVLLGGVRVFRSGFPGEPFCPECGGDDDDSSPDFRLEEGRPEKDWSPNQMRAIENIIRRAGMTGFRLDIEDSAPEVVFRGSLSDVEFRVRVSRDPGAEPLLPWMVEAFNDGERWRQEMEAVGSVVAHAYVEAMAGGLGGSGPPGGQEDRAPSAVDRAAQLRFVADVLSAAAIDGLEMGEPVFRGETSRAVRLSFPAAESRW